MGIAMGPAVQKALAASGVRVIGHQWEWAPGRKGQTFEPHLRRDKARVFNPDGFVGDNAAKYGALPGQGVNSAYCMCTTRWMLRGADGRFLPTQPGVDSGN